jgi:hypothetical protein
MYTRGRTMVSQPNHSDLTCGCVVAGVLHSVWSELLHQGTTLGPPACIRRLVVTQFSHTVWRVIFGGAKFREKSENALRINFRGFKFHTNHQCHLLLVNFLL